MADKMVSRMSSFTLQPHYLAISHGIARMQGSLSDTDNSSVYISFFLVCVWRVEGVGESGEGEVTAFPRLFPLFRADR